MKIIDPSLCHNNFGPLLFDRIADDPRGPKVFSLILDGSTVGELAPLPFTNLAPLLVDQYEPWEVWQDSCWSLDLAQSDGRLIGTHVLFAAQRDDMSLDPLSAELAVWATLMVICGFTGRQPQRG